MSTTPRTAAIFILSRAALQLLALALLTTAPARAAAAADPPPAADDPILKALDQTIDWYRRVRALDQTPARPEEVVARDALARSARRTLRLAFDAARARAELATAPPAPVPPTVRAATTPSTGPAATRAATRPARGQRLAGSATAAAERVEQLQARLDDLNRQLGPAPADAVPGLIAHRDAVIAELDFATARRDVLRRVVELAGEARGGNAGVIERIEALRRSVPEVADAPAAPTAADATAPGASAAAGAAQAAVPARAFSAESAGVYQLVTEMVTLSERMGELKRLAETGEAIKRANDDVRGPIRAQLTDALRRADALATSPEPDDPAQLDARRAALEALTARFRQLSAASVPLTEQAGLLDAARASLLDWRGTLDREYDAALRRLLLRVVVTAVAVVAIVAVSFMWKRATFRYVHDARRRRQFLLLRRIVIGILGFLVIVFSFVTEFGSLATYAGILTAGIAVSLQTVILSAVAYFFFVGRYGVRVGDRVTVGSVTGDVIETGLFRLYLMELSPGRAQRPTGRIVVFSNSVLFQPAGFFKQAPGTDYAWHEVALTLAPDSDYGLAERRLMAAVDEVFGEYKDKVERQHESVRRSSEIPLDAPRPEGRMRFVDAGLEFFVRYPVEIRKAADTDDRITRKLLDAIGQEPRLKLVAAGTPKIQAAQ